MPLTKTSTRSEQLDYSMNDRPKCPHCDEEFDIWEHELYDLEDEGEQEVTCPYCDGMLNVETTVIYRFTTSLSDDK